MTVFGTLKALVGGVPLPPAPPSVSEDLRRRAGSDFQKHSISAQEIELLRQEVLSYRFR